MTNYLKDTKINLYRYLDVTLQMKDKIVGGIPKSGKLIEQWLNAKMKNRPPVPDLIQPTKEEMGIPQTIEQATAQELELVELEEKAWTGFKRDENGLYIEARQLKALCRESGNVTGVTTAFMGAKNYITNGLFVMTPRIYLGVQAPSGYEETVCQIKGLSGTRSAIKRFDYVEKPKLDFQLAVLQRVQGGSKSQIIPMEIIYAIFHHGQQSGLGANRSQGYGTYEITKFEDSPIQEGTVAPWEGLKPIAKGKGKKAADESETTEE